MIQSIEFVVEAGETNLVVDTARAAANEALERITIAPIDGTPRYKVRIALQPAATAMVMRAIMNALEKSG
ncbi:MAG: hypothetical protein JO292_03205 [Betaproteobacteria bacterium]|nr:hypothetical protein [Betaproteobacteria bacterium]MBV9360377.1 hypothetical protein [Betaproteobacteria bacterium]